jgi:hypothetical protein
MELPQKIELVLSASPETILESLGRLTPFVQSAIGRSWHSAHRWPVLVGSLQAARLPCCSEGITRVASQGQQIRHHPLNHDIEPLSAGIVFVAAARAADDEFCRQDEFARRLGAILLDPVEENCGCAVTELARGWRTTVMPGNSTSARSK